MAASSAIHEILVAAAVPEPTPGVLRAVGMFLMQHPVPVFVIIAALVIGVWYLAASATNKKP
ncbi:hypothetical protein ACWEIJ_30445 [Lentzea sp. NPDC004789]